MTDTAANDMTINALVESSYRNAAEHGFWDYPNELDNDATVPMKLMLMVSEISEALESYRDPDSDSLVKVPAYLIEDLVKANLYDDADSDGSVRIESARAKAVLDINAIYEKWLAKPVGFDIELADALIRIFDLAGAMDIDLEAALRRKAEYNRGRPHMHGRRV